MPSSPSQPALFTDPPGVPLGFVEALPPDGLPAPTVVALHGGLVGGRLTFGPVLPAWSRRLRVLVPDRRGFERTPEPATGSIEEQALDLLGFIDARAGGRAHVVGVSYGGVIALTALQLRPSAFRSLALLDAPAVSLVDDDAEVRGWRSELRPWLTPLHPDGVQGTGVPVLVASGGRSTPLFRRVGERVADLLDAQHLVVEGADEAVHLSGRRLLDPLCTHIAHAEAVETTAEPVILQAHDPSWHRRFELERDHVAAVLGHRVLAIEHIGSTAVPGLAAKPIVDILVGVDDVAASDDLVARLEAVGYSWWRDDPSPDRRYLLRAADGVRRFHTHVVTRGGRTWWQHVGFRDALRADAALRTAYEGLKRQLVSTHGDDREAYTAAKSTFIQQALAGRG
jgi:GrpB-like predicted nucleotidyltransferase (UPF0157 family)/pimeloyl-ACP methyl ester carboxylesterase